MSQPEPFAVIYDLYHPGVWDRVRYHRACWGKLYTDIHALGPDHVALVFRSAGPRWLAWETVRRGWVVAPDHDREAT